MILPVEKNVNINTCLLTCKSKETKMRLLILKWKEQVYNHSNILYVNTVPPEVNTFFNEVLRKEVTCIDISTIQGLTFAA